MVYRILANCTYLNRPFNICKHPTHQRSKWSPLRWLGIPVSCVYAFDEFITQDTICAEQEKIPRPAPIPPRGGSSVYRPNYYHRLNNISGPLQKPYNGPTNYPSWDELSDKAKESWTKKALSNNKSS